MDLERKLQALAVRQHGLVTRDQAAELGLGRRAWYSRLRAGTLLPAAPCVAALPGAPPSPERRILAAVLAAGPGAIASHRSSAHLWGVGGLVEAPVDLTFTDRNRSISLPGAVLPQPDRCGRSASGRARGHPRHQPTQDACRPRAGRARRCAACAPARVVHRARFAVGRARTAGASRPPRAARRGSPQASHGHLGHRRPAAGQPARASHGEHPARTPAARGRVPEPRARVRGRLRHPPAPADPRVRRLGCPRPGPEAVRARPREGCGAGSRRVAGPALHLAPHHAPAGLGGIDDPRRDR